MVRNRIQVVLAGINGLYQNGYNTAEIAWQYQFSTVGFTSARIEAQMAAKNAAGKNWKAQYSTDGTTYTDIEGAAWTATANVVTNVAFDLPAACVGQATVYVRFMSVGSEVFNTNYPFDKKAADGMTYCDHSESGFGNLFVLGEAIVEADETAPVLTSTLPADNERTAGLVDQLNSLCNGFGIGFGNRQITADERAFAIDERRAAYLGVLGKIQNDRSRTAGHRDIYCLGNRWRHILGTAYLHSPFADRNGHSYEVGFLECIRAEGSRSNLTAYYQQRG